MQQKDVKMVKTYPIISIMSQTSTFIILFNRVLEVLASAMHKRKNVLESLTMLNFPPKYTI